MKNEKYETKQNKVSIYTLFMVFSWSVHPHSNAQSIRLGAMDSLFTFLFLFFTLRSKFYLDFRPHRCQTI